MKINELQIDDWVYDSPKNGFPMQVTGIFKDGDLYLDFEGNEGDIWESKAEDIAPIPIDEHILENSGFTRVTPGKNEWANGAVFCIRKISKGYEAKVSTLATAFTTCKLHINYVHELQHIFRFFGGKEWEVKL